MSMVNMYQLWVPIVLGSIVLFIASTIIWMVLPYHRKDVGGTPDENPLLEAMRRQNLMPGQYLVPLTSDHAQRKSPEFIKKGEDGPVAMITMMPSGQANLGAILGKYFAFLLVIDSEIAYVARLGLQPGRSVPGRLPFHRHGRLHRLRRSARDLRDLLGRRWRIVRLDVMDAFIYGTLVAGSVGWRWPR